MYWVRLWCPYCFNEDPQGCFNGGYDYVEVDDIFSTEKLLLPTIEEAIAKGEEVTTNIWKYEVVNNNTGNVVYGY